MQENSKELKETHDAHFQGHTFCFKVTAGTGLNVLKNISFLSTLFTSSV